MFLEDFRGPRKTVFHLKIMHLISAGYHGALRAKSTNFQGLVFILSNREMTSCHLNGTEKQKSMSTYR